MATPLASILLVACAAAISGSQVLDLNKGVVVQMFEWRWEDIARECEDFLAPHGYTAITISPPNENLVLPGRPWYERYQAVSYKLTTRSGNQRQLANMLSRCNAVGVRVIADTVINHMTSTTDNCIGTAGTTCNDAERSYPGVPYTLADFNKPVCALNDYDNATEVRVCELVALHDLNQTIPHVRDKIVKYMNSLVDLGMSGFRVDAAKHMYPSDLAVIYNRVKDLNTKHKYPPGTRPFIFQEVSFFGVVNYEEYGPLGKVTDFWYGRCVSTAFLGHRNSTLSDLSDFGADSKKWNLVPDDVSVVFIDNHDLERDGYPDDINYKQMKQYKMAIAFMLARGIGVPKVLSSYNYTRPQDGPPCDASGRTLSPRPIKKDGACSNGWLCQHRWRAVYNMVLFHEATKGTRMSSWWDNGKNQIAFSMGRIGFIAFNNENYTLHEVLQTNLAAGTYCDLISGEVAGAECTGKTVQVRSDGTAELWMSERDEDGVVALLDGYTATR